MHIPQFLQGILGFRETDEIFVGLNENLDRDEAGCRVWMSRFEMTYDIGQVTCTMLSGRGAQRLSDSISSLNLKTLLLETTSIESGDRHHVNLVFSWCIESAMSSEKNRDFVLLQTIKRFCSKDIVDNSSDGSSSDFLVVRPLFTRIPENLVRTTVRRAIGIVDTRYSNTNAEDLDVLFPSNILADLRRQLGADEGSALAYIISADTDERLLRVDFPLPRRWTFGNASAEATSTLIRFTVVFADRVGLINAVMSKLRGYFDVVSSLQRRSSKDGPYTARLEMTIKSKLSVHDALQEQALLHGVFSELNVKTLFINQEPADRNTPKIFIAYDFRRVELSTVICANLRGAVVVTGHCEDDSADWRRFAREQMAQCHGFIGVMPNRDSGPSPNLIWEFEQARQFAVPSHWLVSDEIPDNSRVAQILLALTNAIRRLLLITHYNN